MRHLTQALLDAARNEKDVENAYRGEIGHHRPDVGITSPFGSDGYAQWRDVRALLEFKYDLALKQHRDQCGVLGQMILYLKKFEQAGQVMPNVLFVGDKNECFALEVGAVKHFLALPIDWSAAPSAGSPDLTRALLDGLAISPFVFDVGCDFRDVLDKIEILAKGEVHRVKATQANIGAMFTFWEDNVFLPTSGLTSTEQVDVFLRCLFKPDDVVAHGANKNILVVEGRKIPVNGHQWQSFINHFVRGYKPSEIEGFYASKDRLIEDDSRRRQGAFFTPTLWVAEAHKMIEAELGADWREKCIVWDPACYDDQTRVMTRNGWRYFKDLESTDLIYSLNPQTHLGEYVPFTTKIEIPFNGNLDHYKSDRVDLAVTPNHQMYVLPRLRTDRKPRLPYRQSSAEFRTFLEKKNKVCLPAAAQLDGDTDIPYADDELRFVGFYLGDGYLWKDKNGTCNAVGFHLKKTRKIKFLRSLVRNLGLETTEYTEPSGHIGFRIISPKWVERLLDFQGALTKRLPPEFFSATAQQCKPLLEGLWESDGCGQVYYSSNRDLIEDVERICVHAGASTYLHYRDRDLTPPSGKTYKNYRGWELTVSYHKNTRKSLDHTTTSSLPYDGIVYCVTLTKNHVMLVERNGKTVFCGNCGTGNLTRDYAFGSLILSTLEQSDVDVIREQGYNPGANLFRYDFLNDDSSPFFTERNTLPPSVDKMLREAATAGKRLVFLMNPPYAEHSNAGTTGTSKAGIALTAVNTQMTGAKMGLSSRQLYAQFMYRSAKLADQYGFKKHTVALYSKPTFMCSGSYKPFRDFWYARLNYQSGMLFQASHFADVSGQWGVSFTLWSEGVTNSKCDLPVALKDIRNFEVIETSVKPFYNSDGREASKWVREPIKGLKGVDAPQMSSGLKIQSDGDKTLVQSAALNFNCHANNLMKSGTDVFLTSSCSTGNAGVSVIPGESFRRAIALYAARKLVTGDWKNDKDEYLAPNTKLPGYEQWNDDAVIYALLHTSNNCTAMRNVQYKGRVWRIKNNFWHKTRAESRVLYDHASCAQITADLRAEVTDSYLASILPTLDLSPEARECLAQLDALLVSTLPHRESFATARPELHLMAHDAGVYQLKHLFREYEPEAWSALQASLKALADKLRPGVFAFGFLRQ